MHGALQVDQPVSGREFPATKRVLAQQRLNIRPVEPCDAPLIEDLIWRLSPHSRQLRFHGSMTGCSPAWLKALCCVDQLRHVAYVISTELDGKACLVADVRYFRDDHDDADFAVVVEDRWQRQGLGTWALQTLLSHATADGIRSMRGEVQSHNGAMLGLMRQCAFRCTTHPDDARLLLGTCQLDGMGASARCH